ncbi:MAG TPA: MFS transporter, partial [Gallionella sp.]
AFGGVMGAMVQTRVADVIPFARRARAGGIVSTAFSVSTVAGVPLSLWMVNYFDWRAPFLLIAAMVAVFMAVGLRVLPELRHHISTERQAHPFAPMFTVLRDANHLRALLFSALIISSGFTVIPYITVYAVHNVGISQQDIPYIYLFGGAATLVTARLIGAWADRRGKVLVYRLVAFAALLPILAVTHLGGVPLWVWLVCTTAFFVLVSGRMIPAMAIISSAAQPKLRGTFMSIHATVQSFSMGLATTLAGFIISQGAGGQVVGYGLVGFVAVAGNLLAIGFVARIAMRDQHAFPRDAVSK